MNKKSAFIATAQSPRRMAKQRLGIKKDVLDDSIM